MRFDRHAHSDSHTEALFGNPTGLSPNRPVSAIPSRVRRHPSLQLLHAVMRLAGPHGELIAHAERPWASITFAGTRHTITLAFAGAESIAAGEAFMDALPEHEFAIRGQLVADACINDVTQITLPFPSMVLDAEFLLLDDH